MAVTPSRPLGPFQAHRAPSRFFSRRPFALPGSEGSSSSDSEEASGSDTENPRNAQPGEPPEPNDEALPDFSVVDVNADSARYGEAVSPRDYLGQISAWYFGHST